MALFESAADDAGLDASNVDVDVSASTEALGQMALFVVTEAPTPTPTSPTSGNEKTNLLVVDRFHGGLGGW